MIAQTAQLQTRHPEVRRRAASRRLGEQAKALFGPTRLHYEAIEPVAESFGNLDPEIDARVNDVTNPKQWTGFHRIEQMLWEQQHDPRHSARTPTKLMADVNTLSSKVQDDPAAAGPAGQRRRRADERGRQLEDHRRGGPLLAHRPVGLPGQPQRVRRRHSSCCAPALNQTGNAKLATTIQQRFAAVQANLDRYKRNTALGYALYNELTPADRQKFADEVGALDEPLSTVAAKVSGA